MQITKNSFDLNPYLDHLRYKSFEEGHNAFPKYSDRIIRLAGASFPQNQPPESIRDISHSRVWLLPIGLQEMILYSLPAPAIGCGLPFVMMISAAFAHSQSGAAFAISILGVSTVIGAVVGVCMFLYLVRSLPQRTREREGLQKQIVLAATEYYTKGPKERGMMELDILRRHEAERAADRYNPYNPFSEELIADQAMGPEENPNSYAPKILELGTRHLLIPEETRLQKARKDNSLQIAYEQLSNENEDPQFATILPVHLYNMLNQTIEVEQWHARAKEILYEQRIKKIESIHNAFMSIKQDNPERAAHIVIKLFKGERDSPEVGELIQRANEALNR